MSRILPLGEKASLAVGVGNSTTVGNATVVRVLSTAGAAVVTRTDSSGAIIGSFTTLNNSVDLVEKKPSDFIYVTTAVVEVSKVGFTN